MDWASICIWHSMLREMIASINNVLGCKGLPSYVQTILHRLSRALISSAAIKRAAHRIMHLILQNCLREQY